MVMQLKRPEIAQAGERHTGVELAGRGHQGDGPRQRQKPFRPQPQVLLTAPRHLPGEVAPARPTHGSMDHEDSSGR